LLPLHFIRYTIASALHQGPAYSIVAVVPNGEQLSRVLKMVSEGSIKPVIDSHYLLDSAVKAHAHLEEGHATGKVVLLVP
jgi:NADPH:quinone reductase-like Zn-dependent oxidoreductase